MSRRTALNTGMPSLNCLQRETDKLKKAKSLEEMRQIRSRIQEIRETFTEEAEAYRQRTIREAEILRMTRATSFSLSSEVRLKCPKCHRKWGKSQANYRIEGKGKRKQKTPYCPHCKVAIFREGDDRSKSPIIQVIENPRNLTFKEVK